MTNIVRRQTCPKECALCPVSYVQLCGRYFGSRFDNVQNFGNKSISEVSGNLARLATAVSKVCVCDV